MIRLLLSLPLFLAGCGATLPEPIVRAHPPLDVRVPALEVLERSAPERPAWIEHPSAAPGARVIVGRGGGESLALAKKEAERDLFRAAASLVEVAVDEHLAHTITYEARDDVTHQTQRVEHEIRGQAGEVIRRLRPDADYWEKTRAGGRVVYTYSLRARVPEAHVALARVRNTDPSARWILLRPATGLAQALRPELAAHLDAAAGLRVYPPSLVDTLDAPWAEVEALLAPDVTITVEATGDGCAARYRVDPMAVEGEVTGAGWFEVEARVVEAVASAVQQERS